ncbi:MAG: hypothetical protein U9O98_10640 [Asgard group archaeon]|nr:hypothetical protein [Asgard group archaeon]
MGPNGLELVTSYPEDLPKKIINEIIVKSMPMGAKPGDFTSNVISAKKAFSGYIFKIPSPSGRDNIASLVAVYKDINYDIKTIRKVFSIIINELKKTRLVNIKTVSQMLPNLYSGLTNGHILIRINSIKTIEIEIQDKSENKDSTETIVKNFSEEIW